MMIRHKEEVAPIWPQASYRKMNEVPDQDHAGIPRHKKGASRKTRPVSLKVPFE
jgi:hypothetical protein